MLSRLSRRSAVTGAAFARRSLQSSSSSLSSRRTAAAVALRRRRRVHHRLAATSSLRCHRRWLSTKQSSSSSSKKQKVAVIGSGNWGSVAARIVGQNVLSNPDRFDADVNVWVFEEQLKADAAMLRHAFASVNDGNPSGTIDAAAVQRVAAELTVQPFTADDAAAAVLATGGANGTINLDQLTKWWVDTGRAEHTVQLTDVINQTNENVKYLPNAKLGANVRAVPDLIDAVRGATMLVFVTPHQFIKGLCAQLKPHVAPGGAVKAVSLIKGMDVTEHGFELISGLLRQELDIDCSVLMGANIANEIALEKFSEATVGYSERANGELFQTLFHTPYFHVNAVPDVVGAELCGTLKNIVAIGAGFVDGLELGNNTKAAIIRIGLGEMMKLAQLLFPTVKTATFFESCGVADLITTCFGGRNRKVAEAYVAAAGTKSWDVLEAELLGGQKLQGVLTSHEVQAVLKKKGLEKEFPLFTTINRICTGDIEPSRIVDYADFP
jgi:glycerol-3-phosphate dehydrogenase (NAD+)